MTIAFDLPADVLSVRDGVLRFVEREVAPRVARHHGLLADARRLYDGKGAYAPEVRALIREVRMASAQAGFYGMCAPPPPRRGRLGDLAH